MNGSGRLLKTVFILLLIPLIQSLEAQNARISEWVEDAPASDNSKIALGYPVPIPVDTPLPFAGFRSYKGLHTRHQDLAATTPWTHAIELGQTYAGRTIWLYQLGDADRLTPYGVPEQAMLSNGGIHAREWQTPEVATGIIELLALGEDDDPLISYLRDSAHVLVIPVLNVDGFLQTQRTPNENWMGTDRDYPEDAPRDGRMRRKNMNGPDEDLFTEGDHMRGVDLNRNNPPYWATNPNRSSGFLNSLVHHGVSPHSEPETQALKAAAELASAERLSMYTDIHSYSQVHFWSRNDNDRLARLTEKLLGTFSNHHVAFEAGKYYWFPDRNNAPRNRGIGLTEEFFTQTYQVPSFTLEVEPSGGDDPSLPGGGADYGGLGRNGHDGFILPDSEVPRVRTELAQSFMVAYYQQSGPPSIVAARFIDKKTGATVFEGEWDVNSDMERNHYSFQAQALQLDREYTLWLAYDKPMRWRENGEVIPLPGQSASNLDTVNLFEVGDENLTAESGLPEWLNRPGETPAGFLRYRDDAMAMDFSFPSNDNNNALVDGTVLAALAHFAKDMTGSSTDSDPSTVARWEGGGWSGYENSSGNDLTDIGGTDSSTRFQVTSDGLGDPFVIEAGTSSTWYDPDRNGEGFMMEILSGDRAVMYWFTYDTEGNQDWYMAEGQIRGNRILFPELVRVSGGEFGPDFDPDKVTRTAVGSASFIWSDCDNGAMDWLIDRDGNGRRHGRMNLQRLSRIMGIDCGMVSLPPEIEAGRLSGSWYDPSHSGEGYVLEILIDQRAIVYWFSYDQAGKRRWFYGTGEIQGNKIVFEELFTSRGGVFGSDFDPDQVEILPWGTLELELECKAGISRFSSSEAGFPAGTLDLDRLSVLDGLSCNGMQLSIQ